MERGLRFAANPGRGLYLLISISTALVLIAGFVVWGALVTGIGPGAFLLLLLALVLVPVAVASVLYTISFQLLSYRLDRNGLLISADPWRFSVPMQAIQGIYTTPEAENRSRFRGLRFEGHNVGLQRSAEGTLILYLATAHGEDCLYVKTAQRIYAISPAETEPFLRAFEAERALGALRPQEERLYAPPLLSTLVWRDRLGIALTLGTLLAGVLLLALTFWRYPNLPTEIPMHFDALGRPDRMAPPRDLFYLPLIGSVVLFVNFAAAVLLYRRERLLSYFLWGGAGMVQVLLILALRTITA